MCECKSLWQKFQHTKVIKLNVVCHLEVIVKLSMWLKIWLTITPNIVAIELQWNAHRHRHMMKIIKLLFQLFSEKDIVGGNVHMLWIFSIYLLGFSFGCCLFLNNCIAMKLTFRYFISLKARHLLRCYFLFPMCNMQ